MRILEKVERRLGEKLLLKGDRCSGPKCAMTRRNYPPGIHGRRRRRGLSEFGELLQEKQKVRFLYGLDDHEIEGYVKKAQQRAGLFSVNFLSLLERRLDNAVFRLGLAASRRIARHLVSYRHVTVNGKTVSIPSYQVKKGETIGIREASQKSPLFAELDAKLKKYEPPKWLRLEKEKRQGIVTGIPEADDAQLTLDVAKIKEFYMR